MQDGQVIAASRDGVNIKVRSGSTVSVIQMLGHEGELRIRDIVQGNWTSLGRQTVYRDGRPFTIWIDDWG